MKDNSSFEKLPDAWFVLNRDYLVSISDLTTYSEGKETEGSQ